MSTQLLIALHTQNAAADVEKMILGNKCDLDESRVVSMERGKLVSVSIDKGCRGFKHYNIVPFLL